MLHLFEEAKRSRLAEQVYKLGLTLCHSIIYVCWCVSVRLPLLANSTNNKTANQVANEIITKCCQRVFPAYTDLGEKSCLRVLFAVFGFITSPDVVNYDTCNNSITDPWKGRMHSRDASAKNSIQNQRGRVDGLNVAPSGWSDFIGLLSMTSISLPDTQESLTAEEVSAGVLGFVHCNESRARIPRETLTGGYRLATQLGFDNFRPNFSGWVAVEFLWAAPLQSGPAVERSWQMSCHSTASPRSHITGLISKVFVCNTKSKFRVLPFSSSQLPPPHQLQPSLAVAITVTRPLFGLSS